MDTILKSWPILTVAAIAGSICYGVGCFHYLGISWMSMFSFTDIVTLTWAAIPFIVACFPIGFLVINTFGSEQIGGALAKASKFESTPNTVVTTPPRKFRAWRLLLRAAFFAAAAAAYFGSTSRTLDQLDWVLPLLLLALVLLGGVMVNSPGRLTSIAVGVATLLFAAFSTAYAVGQLRGAGALLAESDDIIVASANARCVNLVFTSSSGLLFTEGDRVVRFIKLDDVTEVARDSGCRRA